MPGLFTTMAKLTSNYGHGTKTGCTNNAATVIFNQTTPMTAKYDNKYLL